MIGMFKKNPIILILLILIILMAASGFNSFLTGDKSYSHEENEWRGPWHMMGSGGFWMFPFFPIIMLAVILYFVISKKNMHWSGSDSDDTPLELLKRRYAKGEINKEEFDEVKKDL